MSRPKANSDFFKIWSDEMAYVLGFVITDGCLVEFKNGCNGLNITNKNKEILELMAKSMNSNHKIGIKTRGGFPKLNYFQIQIRDKNIYADLLKLGLKPRKSKTVRIPNVPSKFFGDFIRGCFDGDGTIVVWQEPRWRHAWQMRSAFCSGSHGFLTDIQCRLHKEVGLTEGSIKNLERGYMLCYSIADSVKLYNFMYKKVDGGQLYLKRKLDKFEFFKKVRPEKFENVLNQ